MENKESQGIVAQYLNAFRQIHETVTDEHVALAVLLEVGKHFRRTLGQERGEWQPAQGNDEPATVRQIAALKALNVRVPDILSKRHASQLIDEHR